MIPYYLFVCLFVFIVYLDLLLLLHLAAYFLSVNIISIMKTVILSVMLTVASWVAGTKLVLDKYLLSEEKGTINRSPQSVSHTLTTLTHPCTVSQRAFSSIRHQNKPQDTYFFPYPPSHDSTSSKQSQAEIQTGLAPLRFPSHLQVWH